jgi:hypothetical protein
MPQFEIVFLIKFRSDGILKNVLVRKIFYTFDFEIATSKIETGT